MKNIIDKLLNEWAKRCEDGIIDFNDSSKLELLKCIINEFRDLSEYSFNTIEEEYVSIIKDKLKTSNIPIPETNITSLNQLCNIQLSLIDQEIFNELYPLKPTTKSGNKNSSIVGKGEIAMYWLLKYNKTPHEIKINSNRGGISPDFTVNNVGFEFKSFEDKYITLGRFQKQSQFGDLLEMLNIAYTLSTIEESTDVNNSPSYSTLSIKPTQLVTVFENVYKVIKNVISNSNEGYNKNLLVLVNRFKLLYFNRRPYQPNLPDTHTKMAAFFIAELVRTKFKTDPGYNGYIINLDNIGNCSGVHITQKLLNSEIFDEYCFSHAVATGGSIKVNFEEFVKVTN